MWRIAMLVVFCAQFCLAQETAAQPGSQNPIPSSQPSTEPAIVVPAGTAVELAVTNPVLTKTAKPGDTVYAETAFPVVVNNRVAIPPGTYVEGEIDALTRPGFFSPHAEFQIHFTEIIFANGYVVEFPGPQNVSTTSSTNTDVIAAVANPYVEVSAASDVLLDNGTQIDMILQLPLTLNRASVSAAASQASPLQLDQFKSATLCRPIPGTPGTPDTVIPGTPGTPGTPDVVVPGAPGMPPTVIPGTPPTPGTPDTVIPGSPGTPGISCPGPPVVTRPKTENYKESFAVNVSVAVNGTILAPGRYEVSWTGPGPATQLAIIENGKTLASASVRMVLLSARSPDDATTTRTNSDGSLSLDTIRFAGESFALFFE
jgi:hypothetical protein